MWVFFTIHLNLVVSTVEPGRPPVDLEENGEENGDIAVDLNIDAELEKSLDGEAANGITNNGTVDVEAIDENASSSGIADALNDSAQHDKVDTTNDDTAAAVATIEAINDTKPVATSEAAPIATSFIHQACYETISNDSVDNVELDLSLNRAEDIADEDIEAAREVSEAKEDENKAVIEPTIAEENKLPVEEEKSTNDEESTEDPAAAAPVEEPNAAIETETANETGKTVDQEEALSKNETPTSSSNLEIEVSGDIESECSSSEAAPLEDNQLENEVALPAETEVEEKAALGESSELEIAAQPTAEASSPTKSASGSNKLL